MTPRIPSVAELKELDDSSVKSDEVCLSMDDEVDILLLLPVLTEANPSTEEEEEIATTPKTIACINFLTIIPAFVSTIRY